LEVADSITGLPEFNSSNQSDKLLYNDTGVTIWQLQPENIPYIDGLNFYAKMEGENLSVMIQSDNESMALRGILPALTENDRQNSFLSTSSEKHDGSYKYDKSKTLIYYILENAFNSLKESSAIPSEAYLTGHPSYRSEFSDRTYIFGYYLSVSEGPIYDLPAHNWPIPIGKENGITLSSSRDGSVDVIFNFSSRNLTHFGLFGWAYNSSGDDSRISSNDAIWLKGRNSKDIRYGNLDFPSNLRLFGKNNNTTKNDSAILAMIWAALDAEDLKVIGRIDAQDMNQSTSSNEEVPDVLEKIDMVQSDIIWPSLAIYNMNPEDGANLASDDVLFSWRTNRNGSTKLFYREVGEEIFRNETGEEGLLHKVPLNLKRNASYEFYVRSEASNDSDDNDQSQLNQIFIDNGVAFTEKEYNFDIDRDYSQIRFVSVKNTDTEPHEILVNAENPYRDIYLGFVGNGSLNNTLMIGPGKTENIEFVVHAQDVPRDHYDVMLRLNNTDEGNITDMAMMRININWPEFNVKIVQIDEDKETLVKKFRIDNLGDTLTDFSVAIDDSLKGSAYLYPSITHYNLIGGSSMEFFAIPIFQENSSIAEGNMTAIAANESENYALVFECSEGRRPYRARAEMPLYVIDLAGWYCTNNPDIKIPFTIPPGFNSSDVISAKIEMNFSLPWDRSSYVPHDVYVSLNEKAVGSIINSIPEGKHEFNFSSEILNYGSFSAADNVIRINTKHLPQMHYVVNTQVRIRLCLKNIDRWICALDAEEASDILWRTPGIERNYPSLNVSQLNPFEGEMLPLGMPVLINVSVMGNETGSESTGAQLYADVRASFSIDDTKVILLDDGMHGDGKTNDGFYAGTWTPQIPGNSTITVRAANCRSDSAGSDNTTVLIVIPDLNITSLSYSLENENPVEGQPINISFKVTNLGSGIAQNHLDELSIDGVVINSSSAEPLRPGESCTWNYPYIGFAGNHTVSVCSDISNEVYERDENNNCRETTLNISPRSDLNVTSLIHSPENPVEGQFVEIAFTVTNLANGTAWNHLDNLSIDGAVVNSSEAGPLAPGESHAWNFTYINGTAGNHTIIVCSDTRNEVYEWNKNNNCRETTLNIDFPSDLNITSMSYSPENPIEGQTISINFTVTNLANGTAWNHLNNLSIDGVAFNSSEAGLLEPRESRTWNYLYNNGTAGNHTISVCSDTWNEVYESDENNNCRNISVYIRPRSDLNVTSLTYSPKHPVEGQSVEIAFMVTNLGNGTAENHTENLSIDRVVVNSSEAGPLEPRESRTWNYLYNNGTAGYHTISVCADSELVVNESNENNNCNETTYNIDFPSDLNITSMSYSPENPIEGQTISINFTVTNLANGTAWNHLNNLSIDGVAFNSSEAGPLEPRESRTWNYLYNNGTAGYHTISVCADSRDEVYESNENNNCGNKTIYVGRPVDLNITSLDYSPKNPFEGQPINITFTVNNLGDYIAENHVNNLSIDGVAFNSSEAGPLEPRESRTWNYLYNNGTAGYHTISVCADSRDEVYESNENNNCRGTPLYIPPRPDFGIIITDKSGSDLVEYPVLIDLFGENYPDRLHNRSQLIFLDKNGNILDYWVEELEPDSKQAKVWVKVPYVPKLNSSEISLNISRYAQLERNNGSSVFEFFDDFEDDSLDDGLWTYRNDSNSFARVEGGYAVVGANSNTSSSAILTSRRIFVPPRAVRFEVNFTEAKLYEWKGVGFLGEDVGRSLDDVKDGVYWRWQDKLLLAHHIYQTAQRAISYVSRLGEELEPGYKVWETSWLADRILYYADGKQADPHVVQLPIEGIPVAFSLNRSGAETPSDISIDWVLVRKCVYPEPGVRINESIRRSRS